MAVRGLLLCVLKLMNFILLVAGISMIIYSGWIYKEWNEDSSPAPTASFSLPHSESMAENVLRLSKEDVAIFGDSRDAVPWFIYSTFGAGVFIVLVTLTGACAAESEHSFCFSCYESGLLLLLVIQGAIAALIFFDNSWERDLPDDPTGQARKAKHFIQENLKVFKWGGIGVLAVELLALVIAMVLRSTTRRVAYAEEDEFVESLAGSEQAPILPQYYAASHQPQLFSPTLGPISSSAPVDPRNDAWRTRMVEKYGLDPTELAERQVRAGRSGAVEKNECSLL